MRKRYPLLAVALALGLSTTAFAQGPGAGALAGRLAALNASGARGNATVSVEGNQVTVNIPATGLVANQPHAQHIHIGGQNTCPSAGADQDGDGFISVAEGQPSYGPIMVSLTTEGDVSANSGLAVERMPKANANGTVNYSRTFQLPEGVTAADIAKGVIVQHGIDPNRTGQYDGDKKSELNPQLPFEATAPADCGKLVSMAGMPATGAGGAADFNNLPVMGLGLAGAILAAGALVVSRRRAQAA